MVVTDGGTRFISSLDERLKWESGFALTLEKVFAEGWCNGESVDFDLSLAYDAFSVLVASVGRQVSSSEEFLFFVSRKVEGNHFAVEGGIFFIVEAEDNVIDIVFPLRVLSC